jgi:membrane fusion protein (multidrug efflux system)
MHHSSSSTASFNPAAPSFKKASKTRLLLWGGGLIVAVIAATWWGAKPSKPGSTERASGGKPREAASLSVTGVVVAPTTFTEVITANGTLRADEAVELQTEINGKVAALNFAEGQRVKAGEVLVKIDDSGLQASLRRAQARLELAQVREKRLARLVAEGGVSKLEYDESRGELAVLETEIDIIRAEINKTSIRAPFDGVVGLRFVSVGAYVAPATRIATLQNLSNLKVDFSIPERYATFVKPGAGMTFTVAGSTATYAGGIAAIEPRIDISTRTILLRALCSNPDLALIPGLFARVEFPVRKSDQALLVPAIAVVAGLEERFVFVARDGKAVRVRIRTGARTDTQVQVVEGLSVGDVLLTSGVQQLRAGLPVKVVLPKT